MNRGLTFVELLLIVVVIAALAILVLPYDSHRSVRTARLTSCCNNLSQLYKMQQNYRVSQGTPKLLPTQTGGAFWLQLTRTTPPLIDSSLYDIFRCPVRGIPLRPGEIDYRGPATDANMLRDNDLLGADRAGNHGPSEGGTVLRVAGDVQCVAESDASWRAAATNTVP